MAPCWLRLCVIVLLMLVTSEEKLVAIVKNPCVAVELQ